jgi:hypothetical protein
MSQRVKISVVGRDEGLASKAKAERVNVKGSLTGSTRALLPGRPATLKVEKQG